MLAGGISRWRSFVAEVDKIWRYVDIESLLPLIPKPELVYDKLPNRRAHGWKFIAFRPDGQLCIPIGSPCNSCDAEASYAHIVKVDFETMVQTDDALGVRNSVGFDWHPLICRLWFSDNGRDRMGDDIPDDEIKVNVLTVKDSQVIHNRPFVTGWLKEEKFSGRPVAFLELDDGSLLLSDDYAGVVYRISYQD